MDAVSCRILIDNELKSDQPGLLSFCEAVVQVLRDESLKGRTLTVLVKRGSDVVISETVTL